MVYITGDTHGDFARIKKFCKEHTTTTDDLMIILGDAGINFFGDKKDVWRKDAISQIPIKFLCIHGNHEMRPAKVSGYSLVDWHGGKVYLQYEYPTIMFAKDGEIYDIVGYQCIAIGGAYSVDKFYRLQMDLPWFPDEQPSGEIKSYVENRLKARDWKVDVVLSHTVPFEYMPIDLFIPEIDQSTVDSTTENWLSDIEIKLEYKWWYAGHFHTDRITESLQIMYENVEPFMSFK